MHANRRLIRAVEFLDRLSSALGRGAVWLTPVMVAVTFLVVVLRYGFSIGWIALQESVMYLHAVVLMTCMAFVMSRDGHVRVDIVYRRLKPRARAWIDAIGSLLLVMPFCVYLFWTSWSYVAASWAVREGSREAGGLPGVFLIKTLILVLAVTLLIQAICKILGAFVRLRGAGPDNDRV